MSRAYYNEIDPFCAEWLFNLQKENLIAPGDIDTRDIRDVKPSDLSGYAQCHFFAGIGGWSYALRLAGWPDEEPVWTGSCPCQPFSGIGRRQGFSDERHLWPAWFDIIRKCRPAIIFGEQVAKATIWLDLVFANLEAENYACAAADLPAAGVGARQTRQRLWFVANTNEARRPHAQGLPAAKAKAHVGRPAGMVHRYTVEHLRGTFEPDQDWVVDGLFGEGAAVGALGNAIVPQVAAEFILASCEALST